MLGRRKRIVLILFSLLSIFAALSWTCNAQSQDQRDATIIQSEHSDNIRTGNSDTWSFTVHNWNCSDNTYGSAKFFFEIYVDGSLFFDEYNSTTNRIWNCSEGQSVTQSYLLTGWSATRPISHDVNVDLYWYKNGAAILEDSTKFKVDVTVVIPLQHIYASSYLAAYVIACFLLLAYDYVASLEE